MKFKLGVTLILVGCLMLAAAAGLFFFNEQEQETAASASQEAIVKVVDVIREQRMETATAPTAAPLPDSERTLTVREIDGYGYIGFLTFPTLNLELPVMADWSDPQLKIAPCRYTGSVFTDDLVIMAHNYKKHFGRIKRLNPDDPVIFTDMDGNSVEYRVVAQEILTSGAIEEMTSGEFDLTLFTCTYGGVNRITIRCDRAEM